MASEEKALQEAIELQVAASLRKVGDIDIFAEDSDEDEEEHYETSAPAPVVNNHNDFYKQPPAAGAAPVQQHEEQSSSQNFNSWTPPLTGGGAGRGAAGGWSEWQASDRSSGSGASGWRTDEWASYNKTTRTQQQSYGKAEVASASPSKSPAERPPNSGSWSANDRAALERTQQESASVETQQDSASGSWSNWQRQSEWKDWKSVSLPRPPPPPPGPPPPDAGQSYGAQQSHDVLDALRALIEAHDNLLPGTAFEELYRKHSTYRDIVKTSGGPKKFVEQHGDLFTWVRDGVPGGSVKKAEGNNDAENEWWSSASPARPEAGAAPPKLPEGTAMKWLEEVIAWQKDGYLPDNKVFKEIGTWKTSQEAASFRAEVESCGGLAEFVRSQPKSLRMLTHKQGQIHIAPAVSTPAATPAAAPVAAPAAAARRKECVDVLVEVLKWNGGNILAAQVLRQLKEWDVANFEKHKKEIDAAGGVKKYVSWYPEQCECSLAGGAGTETVYLKTPIVRSPACEDTIAELLAWRSGFLLASRLLPELHSWRPKEHAACKRAIDDAGGIKKFVSQFPLRFSWTLENGPGTEAIQLLEEEEEDDENETLLTTLTELLEWHRGNLLSSRIFIDMKAWRPEAYEGFRKEITQLGGLKKFVAGYPTRFMWVSDTDAGKDSIKLVKQEPASEPLAVLLEQLIEWHGGSLLASKVFKNLRAWNPLEVDRLRTEVEDCGSLKKLVQSCPDKFEWVIDSDPGKEIVRLVKPKEPVVVPPPPRETAEVADTTSDFSRYQ